ncbi:Xylose isomerase domain protein TIM barrel [Fibrella aestuarina BUZ 2]|uniref:Xylose isomerase domain protein TIM barrel n=1 Tax=Fibrella aestuarina BUZ 2 TaxID=1166018 RepID=I0KG60_9BACT|nr:sugar phosphate isomerase/epimerase [Fibrella aestuarina]CCH03113.1 Xylose isomerase domain protein TIM barrel [Fibrella aestuarina BUZ 2]
MKQSLLIALAVGLALPALAQPSAPVGLELYSFREQFAKDVPGTMAIVKQMGFREVEVAGTYGLSAAAFRKELDKNGLKAVSMGADFEDLESNVPKVIEDAKALGVSYVVCAWIPHTEDIFSQGDADRAIDVFNTAGRLLADQNIKFCYHTHGYEFGPVPGFSGNYFDYLAANLNPRYVNFEMDVYWIKAPGQDPLELLNKYRKRFPLAHLKDRKPGTPLTATGHADVETNVALGDGDIGIAQFMAAAKRAGVKHFFIEDESSRSMEQMPRSLAFLRGLK